MAEGVRMKHAEVQEAGDKRTGLGDPMHKYAALPRDGPLTLNVMSTVFLW